MVSYIVISSFPGTFRKPLALDPHKNPGMRWDNRGSILWRKRLRQRVKEIVRVSGSWFFPLYYTLREPPTQLHFFNKPTIMPECHCRFLRSFKVTYYVPSKRKATITGMSSSLADCHLWELQTRKLKIQIQVSWSPKLTFCWNTSGEKKVLKKQGICPVFMTS